MRRFVTTFLILFFFTYISPQTFAQDKAEIKSLVEKYKSGIKLNESELKLIDDIIHPAKSVHYQNPPSAPKGALSEGFEGTTFPPDGWTTINNDGGSKEWVRSTSDPHSGSAHASVSYEAPNDDWLITPRLTVSTGDHFTFWAKSSSSSWLEDFNVKVSKTGTNISDFTITLEEVRGASDSYTEYSYDLTGGGYGINDGDNIYIAIQCVSDDKLALYIDDVTGPEIYTSSTEPGDPSNPSPADGATDVALSGTLTWDFGANTDAYDLWFGESGSMSKVVDNASTSSSSGSYSYSNLSTGTNYQWQVIAKNTSTSETTNGPVWGFTTALPTDMYQVGNGANTDEHLPIDPYYNYTYSQTLYFASDLSSVGSDKRISKIYYNYTKSSTNDHDADDWVVYIGTTSATSLSDWVDVSSLTKVFDGNSGFGDLAAGDGWIEITLDTPFNYDPSTDGNLIVAVDENTSSYTSYSDDFYCDQNTSKANVSIEYHNDSTNPDPATPPSEDVNLSAYYPNIRFQFEDIPTTPVFSVNPESKDYGTVFLGESSSEQTFTVTNTGGGTLTISSAPTITGTNTADFSITTDDNSYPVELTNGQSATWGVTFTPQAEGSRSANLHIVADAKVDHDVPLSGTGHNATVSTFPYSENFDAAAALPTDWQQDPSNTEDWEFGTSAEYAASSDHTTGSGNIAWIDDSTPHTTDPISLLTPPFDISGLTTPTVSFYYWIGRGNGRASTLHVDVYDGTTWHNDVTTALTENGQWDKVTIDITSYKSNHTRVRFRGFEDPTNYDSDISIDDFRIGEPVPLSLNSVTVTQASTANALLGSTNKEILMLNFNVDGDVGTLPLNSIIVTPTNTSNADVAASGVKLYRTTTSTFATDNLVATQSIGATVTFSGIAYNLPAGNTYFWVTYDVASNGTVGNTLDAKIAANGIDVNGTTYNATDDDPTGARTISGLSFDGANIIQASTQDINIGDSDNEILRIDLTVSESTTSGAASVDFTALNVTTTNTNDADVTNVKLYRTSTSTFATDNLVATGTIGKGSVTFNLSEQLTSDMYYWITYDISSSATDGNTVDAKIPVNGMTIGGSTYNATEDDPTGSRTLHQFNSGGDGTNYGGYFWSNSTSNSQNSNPPSFIWIDPVTEGHTEITDWTDDGTSGGDDSYFDATIPFTFTFFGNDYTHAYINSNGAIQFTEPSSGATGSTLSIPSETDPDNLIAGCLMDLDDGTDGKIYYGTESGNFVVTWWHYHDYGDATEWITFQIILKQNGNIKVQYNYSESSFANEITSSTILGDALIGIENADGTVGIQYRNNGVGGPMFDNNGKANDVAVEYGQNEGALPVELTSFTAIPNKDGEVEIKWETATEINTASFEVERSLIPENENEEQVWEKIASVKAAGTSNSPKNYSVKDELSFSGKYAYRLKIVDIDGNYEYGNVVEVTANIVLKYELSQNYPNPFNPSTTIKFSIKKAGRVNLTIYNALGQKVTELLNKEMKAGKYKVQFNASNLASGVYFYRINSGNFSAVKKMLLLK